MGILGDRDGLCFKEDNSSLNRILAKKKEEEMIKMKAEACMQ